jgi:site-specific DNA-methyltransferase (adenine-specific)
MNERQTRSAPGRVRDAILQVMSLSGRPLSVKEIEERVCQMIGDTPTSSIRSYLRLNTPGLFLREARGLYTLAPRAMGPIHQESPRVRLWREPVRIGRATLYHADCFDWIGRQEVTIHAVIADPPCRLQYTRTAIETRRGKAA